MAVRPFVTVRVKVRVKVRPTAVQLVHLEHLLELGVPDPAGLLADALRIADVAVTGLRQRRPQGVHRLGLDDVEDDPGL